MSAPHFLELGVVTMMRAVQLNWTQTWRALARLALVFLAGACFASASAEQQPWRANYFPNIALQDHAGRHVRFYDDLIRNRIVAINFVYTECTTLCPLDTAQLRQVQEILGDRVGRDIFMYSISINPHRDTPTTLRRYMQAYDIKPGWTFLVGDQAEVTQLQRRLGITPANLANLSTHETSIIMGNERTGQWIKRSSFENPQNLANILGNVLSNYAQTPPVRPGQVLQSYTAAGRITDNSQGIYLFRTRCAACHTIGGGDRLGPDLKGVTKTRQRAWLMRWIREPDKMLAEGDPTATALKARFRNVAMPNMGFGDSEASAVLDFIEAQSAQPGVAGAASAPATRKK